jgi:sigma-B regulation protein RsbU (phosphoserine phosphatase)
MITSLVFQYLSPSGGNVRDKKSGSSDRLISPVELIKGIDKEFPYERFNRYFTMIYMILNFNTGHFTYCCAGHPPIFKLNAANDVELYSKGGAFIGMCDMGPKLKQGQGQLLSGERLFFYTDGIVEHENRVDQPFGQKRLIEVIQSTQAAPLEQAVKSVIQKVRTYADNKTPIDDFSLLGVELLL